MDDVQSVKGVWFCSLCPSLSDGGGDCCNTVCPSVGDMPRCLSKSRTPQGGWCLQAAAESSPAASGNRRPSGTVRPSFSGHVRGVFLPFERVWICLHGPLELINDEPRSVADNFFERQNNHVHLIWRWAGLNRMTTVVVYMTDGERLCEPTWAWAVNGLDVSSKDPFLSPSVPVPTLLQTLLPLTRFLCSDWLKGAMVFRHAPSGATP